MISIFLGHLSRVFIQRCLGLPLFLFSCGIRSTLWHSLYMSKPSGSLLCLAELFRSLMLSMARVSYFLKSSNYTPQPIESIDRVDHKLAQVESIDKSSTRSIELIVTSAKSSRSLFPRLDSTLKYFTYYFFTK